MPERPNGGSIGAGLLLALFSCALGYMAGVAQYSSRIALVEASTQQSAQKISVIYDALVKRGLISTP